MEDAGGRSKAVKTADRAVSVSAMTVCVYLSDVVCRLSRVTFVSLRGIDYAPRLLIKLPACFVFDPYLWQLSSAVSA